MKDDTFCAVVELYLKVLFEDLADDRMCQEADLCVVLFSDDRVFRLYQRALGCEDDSSPRGVDQQDLQRKSERRCRSLK